MRRERPTRCYTIVYWTYNLLNMFWVPLWPSSGAWDYTDVHSMWHIALVMVGCRCGVWLYVLCATCCEHLYSLKLLMMGIKVPETRWANYKFNKQLCSILLLFLSSYHRRCTDKHTSSSPDLMFVIFFSKIDISEHLRDLYLGTGLPLTRHFQYYAAISTLASLQKVIHSFSSLSYDRSKASSKASSPHSAI
jgi:hypothetical protein